MSEAAGLGGGVASVAMPCLCWVGKDLKEWEGASPHSCSGGSGKRGWPAWKVEGRERWLEPKIAEGALVLGMSRVWPREKALETQ